MANALSIWVAFFCVLLQQARSQSCGAGSTDCRCIWTDPTTNQPVIFDLGGAFTYPLILSPVLATSDYQYYFSPCAVIDCGTTTTPSNVCQESSARTVQYNAGASPKWAVTSSNTATIIYSATTGATTRTTTVTVVLNKNAANNSVSLVTEGIAKYSFTVTLAGHTCTPDPTFGGCICRGVGFALNISKTFKYPYTIKGQDGGYQYTYSPCTPIACGTSLSSVCQKDALTGMEYNCGVTAAWEVTSILPLNFFVIYTVPGSPRITVVTINQTSSVSSPTTSLVTTALSSTYVFTIYLPLGGSSSGDGGSSGDVSGYVGFILISIIIAVVIAYFVIGALIMYQFKGARGIEIIPNIGFWKDLPFLIKDGVVFAFSPCCGQRSSYTKM